MPLSYWKKVHKQASQRGELGRSKSLAGISQNPYQNNEIQETVPLNDTPTSRRSHSFSDLASLDEKEIIDDTEVKQAAEVMTQTLNEINTDDDELNYQILRASLNLNYTRGIQSMIKPELMNRVKSVSYADLSSVDMEDVHKSIRGMGGKKIGEKKLGKKIGAMVLLVLVMLIGLLALLFLG